MIISTSSKHDYLNEDFPDHADFLLQFFPSELQEEPLCFDHVDLALDYFDADQNIVHNDLASELRAGYSYLNTAIVCLDALIDNQPLGSNLRGPEIAKSLPLLIVGSLHRINNFVHFSGIQSSKIFKDINFLFSDLVAALYEGEKNNKLAYSRLTQTEHDHKIIVNSAKHIFFLFELVATACSKQVPQHLYDAIENFIYLTKLEDDLSDWREDFISERYNSSFLNECLAKFNYLPSVLELENLIYICGYYESWLSKIIVELELIKENLKNTETRELLLIQYVSAYQSKLKQRVKDIVGTKEALTGV